VLAQVTAIAASPEATATAAATAAKTGGVADITGVILGAVIAAVALMIGHSLTHLYASRRERRADLAATLDKTVAAFVAGDRALGRLLLTVADQAGNLHAPASRAFKSKNSAQDAIQEAANAVEGHEVDMRSAVFSLRMRLHHGAALADAFEGAVLAATDVYVALEPAFGPSEGARRAALDEAHQRYEEFRRRFDDAMEVARKTIAPRRS